MARLRIGSRGSQLALWQANHVAEQLRTRGHESQIEVIKTTGDHLTEIAFAQVGTKGMFTKELEEALSEKLVDIAVHSLKDLPTELPPDFELAAVMKREDARDAFLSQRYAALQELPHAASVGTSSLRREAQLRALRPDLKIRPLRGNVDTRLGKLEAGEFEAIILAAAGLKRLGKEAVIRQIFECEQMCPAAGQGALAVEVRRGDHVVKQAVAFLDDPATGACTECERALLQTLGGGCQVPIGAHARRRGDQLFLLARVARPDGSGMLTERGEGSDPAAVGREVGERLLARGAGEILRAIYGAKAAAPQQP